MKRYMLCAAVALAVVSLTLIPGVAAAAGKRVNATAKLSPVGDEPKAAGQATVSGARFVWSDYVTYNCGLKVSCTGLTPGETYWVPSTYFSGSYPAVADSHGSFTWSSTTVGFTWLPKNFGEVWVYRQTAAEPVLVLYGIFH